MTDVLRTRLFWAGLLGVTVGFLVPFLQLLGVLPFGMILSFIGWFCSVGGLMLGILSVGQAYRSGKSKERNEDMWPGG